MPGHDAKGSIDGVGATTFRVRREGGAIIASSDDAHAPWALQVGERIARAEASGEVRIESRRTRDERDDDGCRDSVPAAEHHAPEQTPVFRQVDQPLAVRARDLLDRLTPDERIAMLHQAAPAIERLGRRRVPHRLRGAARRRLARPATVFPQPVGLAATWDADLVEQVGEVAAVEVRAKRAENPMVSLNVWAPVVNPLRHPRLGAQRGGLLRGPAPHRRSSARRTRGACAATTRGSGARCPRSSTSSATTTRPTARRPSSEHVAAHAARVRAARLPRTRSRPASRGGMMLAYNLVNGRPAHTQPELVAEARSWSDESIAVVSDAGAPTFLVDHPARSARPRPRRRGAACARALDSFTDNDANAEPTIGYLTRGARRGPARRPTTSTGRCCACSSCGSAPASSTATATPTRAIGVDAIDLPAARELAREAAARSVVVLRERRRGAAASPRRGGSRSSDRSPTGAHRLVRRHAAVRGRDRRGARRALPRASRS